MAEVIEYGSPASCVLGHRRFPNVILRLIVQFPGSIGFAC